MREREQDNEKERKKEKNREDIYKKRKNESITEVLKRKIFFDTNKVLEIKTCKYSKFTNRY